MTTNKFTNVVQNLNQGISQQDAALRFPAQVEDATNIIFDTALGARKRHGSFTKGASSPVSNDFKFKMHKIERDDDEEYAVIIGRQADSVFLEVFDLVNDVFATTNLTGQCGSVLGTEQSPVRRLPTGNDCGHNIHRQHAGQHIFD